MLVLGTIVRPAPFYLLAPPTDSSLKVLLPQRQRDPGLTRGVESARGKDRDAKGAARARADERADVVVAETEHAHARQRMQPGEAREPLRAELQA